MDTKTFFKLKKKQIFMNTINNLHMNVDVDVDVVM